MHTHTSLRGLVAERFDWAGWEALILDNGITIDRPYRTPHPRFPEIIYPIDYGYIKGTRSTDGEEVDIFVGTAENGLVGVLMTTDYRKGDREIKLLYNCTPQEIYLTNGFINFDRHLMEGTLVLRYPMRMLWEDGVSGSRFQVPGCSERNLKPGT